MFEVLSRFRPLLVEGNRLFAGWGLDLYASDDFGESFSPVATCQLSAAERWASRIRILSRVGRLGFHSLRVLPDGTMSAVADRHLLWCKRGGDALVPVFRIPRGSRPLNLAVDGTGSVYFGEYFSNAAREEVHVYGSEDGRRWQPVYTFPAGSIRHVHGVIRDDFREGLWVLTGDADDECGLWFTSDRFRTLNPVKQGSQWVRAISVLPAPEGLIVPTDSPRIQNQIQFLDLSTQSLERLCAIPGSAFHALQSGDLYLISTVSEPSPMNDERTAAVYASLDGRRWRCITRVEPDLLVRALPFARRVLRYPEVALVPGTNRTPFVYGFGRSVDGADGRLLRWSRSRVRNKLESLVPDEG